MKQIIIRGDFTDAEFAELVALIRRLDDRRPNARFELIGIDPTQSSTGAEQVLRDALPDQPGRHTEWVSFKYRD
jgi:hypothetical protein